MAPQARPLDLGHDAIRDLAGIAADSGAARSVGLVAVGGVGTACIGSRMLSPQSRDNNKIVSMATMDTTALSGKGLAWRPSTSTWSPRVPRTQP